MIASDKHHRWFTRHWCWARGRSFIFCRLGTVVEWIILHSYVSSSLHKKIIGSTQNTLLISPQCEWCRKRFYNINTKCRTTTSTPAMFFLKLATQKFRHRIINDVKSLKNSCRNDGLSTVTFSSMKRRIFSISSPDGASPFFFCRQCFKAFCSSPLTLQNKLERLTYQVFSG